MTFETLVQCDGRLTNAVYVVERDHAIDYAGTSFHAAKAVVKGGRSIEVWHAGRSLGLCNSDGKWIFKTQDNPSYGIESRHLPT